MDAPRRAIFVAAAWNEPIASSRAAQGAALARQLRERDENVQRLMKKSVLLAAPGDA
jgi:hypothetical protein